MDLSNLRTSLDGLDESSSRRRAVHLDGIEHDLNTHFRASALQLTTLYRQAVTSSKSAYEKGYAHALAHVLELWDTDRDWLRGYIQRRIEAVEQQAGDDDDQSQQQQRGAPSEMPPQDSVDLDEDDDQQQAQRHNHRSTRAGPSIATPRRATGNSQVTIPTSVSTPRPSGKRTRSTTNTTAAATPTIDTAAARARRPRRSLPAAAAAATSSTPTHPFSSSFDFSIPTSLAMTPFAAAPSPHAKRKQQTAALPVIKISDPASQRRRLRKLSGLRTTETDRIIEIDHQHPTLRYNPASNDMQDDEQDDTKSDLWTDDDDDDDDEADQDASMLPATNTPAAPPLPPPRHQHGGKHTTWTERSVFPQPHTDLHQQVTDPPVHVEDQHQQQQRVLERIDRRKRRRSAHPSPTTTHLH